MLRVIRRIAAVGSVVAVLVITGNWPAGANGALGLNAPTGEPLAWTVAVLLVFGGLAFVVRAVARLRR